MMAPTFLKAGLFLFLSQLQLSWAADTSSVTTSAHRTGSPILPTGLPRPSGAAADCNLWWLIKSEETCPGIEGYFGLSHNEFRKMNTNINDDCSNLEAGKHCCVGVPGSSTFSIAMSVTNAPTKGITTTSANGISTPTPIQTGMTTKCKLFYQVADKDDCAGVATKYNIPLETFYKWNPAVRDDCAILQVGYSVCVKEIDDKPQAGATTMTTMTTMTTVTKKTGTSSVTSSVTTPTPFQSGMVNNCYDFFYVKTKDDTCASIAELKGISADDIKKWNPSVKGVKNDCSELWLNYHICTGAPA
ncbi:hypothetical protein V8C34DRAFT_318880 [Trichoderma compactum]